MNVNTAVVPSAGSVSGRMIRVKMRRWPQPSIFADSVSSFGRPRMNCTIKNT